MNPDSGGSQRRDGLPEERLRPPDPDGWRVAAVRRATCLSGFWKACLQLWFLPRAGFRHGGAHRGPSRGDLPPAASGRRSVPRSVGPRHSDRSRSGCPRHGAANRIFSDIRARMLIEGSPAVAWELGSRAMVKRGELGLQAMVIPAGKNRAGTSGFWAKSAGFRRKSARKPLFGAFRIRPPVPVPRTQVKPRSHGHFARNHGHFARNHGQTRWEPWSNARHAEPGRWS